MDKKRDGQIIIKIICVIASFILWLYLANSENPETQYTKTVPVTLENVEALSDMGLALVKSEKEVTIRVKGPMLEVNALNDKSFTLSADLTEYALKRGISRIQVNVDSKPDNIKIVDPENLKIEVEIDTLMEKSVPVRVGNNITVKEGYKQFNPIFSPSSVYISGPEQYVRNVTHALAKVDIKDGDKDQEYDIVLQPSDDAGRAVRDVKVNPQKVNVVVPIKKTKTVGIIVQTKGTINRGMILNPLVPNPAEIEIAGDSNVLKDITAIKTAIIDLDTINGDQTKEVPLELDSNIVVVNGQNTVSVAFDVDKIVQRNISKEISFINLGQDYEYTADRTTVSMVLVGPQSIINSLKEENIQCTVELSNLGEGEYDIQVEKQGIPNSISIESSFPDKVKVNVDKKPPAEPADTPTNTGPGTGSGSGTGTGNNANTNGQ